MLRLTAAGMGDLELTRDNGYVVRSFDLGDAETREVVTPAVDADGTIDTTSLVGSRNVTINLRLVRSDSAPLAVLRDRLRAFTSPRLRPVLFFTEDGYPERFVSLRRGPFVAPATNPIVLDVVLQFVAPNGVLESAALNTETILPGAEEGAPGVEFDVEFGPTVEFPAVAAPGAGEVRNAGNFDAYPVVRLFGPFGDEGNGSDETVVGNLTTGRTLTFAGTAIAAGDYLEIDTRAKTIRVNGLAAQSRQDRLVFPDSQWFTLPPGISEVAFRPDTASGNAQAEVRWRSAWL